MTDHTTTAPKGQSRTRFISDLADNTTRAIVEGELAEMGLAGATPDKLTDEQRAHISKIAWAARSKVLDAACNAAVQAAATLGVIGIKDVKP